MECINQSISIFAEKGSAKLIEFKPKLDLHSVTFPNNVSFIIAKALAKSTKSDTLPFRYNKRVAEIAIICKSKRIENVPILYELKTKLNISYEDLAILITNT